MEIDPVKSDPAESEMKDEPSTSAETDDKQKKRKVVGSSQKHFFNLSQKKRYFCSYLSLAIGPSVLVQ